MTTTASAENTASPATPLAITSQPITAPTYSIKKFREWATNDGGGCHGEIYHKGKKIAAFTDDGMGGGIYMERPYPQTEDWAAGMEAFRLWANAHPALPYIWAHWGFEAIGSDHSETVIDFLISEHRIAKDVKKGYITWQTDNPLDCFTAKQGRKRARFCEAGAEWLKKTSPDAICRNSAQPNWVV
jgi:hypothetical protein